MRNDDELCHSKGIAGYFKVTGCFFFLHSGDSVDLSTSFAHYDIFSEIKTGTAHTDPTAVDLVVKSNKHTHMHTHTCQTGRCQHVLTPRLCCQVLRTEGEGERGRDVIK